MLIFIAATIVFVWSLRNAYLAFMDRLEASRKSKLNEEFNRQFQKSIAFATRYGSEQPIGSTHWTLNRFQQPVRETLKKQYLQ